MNRNIIKLMVALFCSAILFSCSDDDLPTYQEALSIDKKEVSIDLNSDNTTAVVNVTEGNGNYRLTLASGNRGTASATLEGTNKITITGLRVGTTTVTVNDWVGYSAVIAVEVIDSSYVPDPEEPAEPVEPTDPQEPTEPVEPGE